MHKIQNAQNAHQPVESLQAIMVQILAGKPRPVRRISGHSIHHRHDHRAQIVPHRQRRPGQRRRQRSHARRRLGEEELH